MDSDSIHICHCGPGLHLADVAELRARGLPVPHQHATWPLYDSRRQWWWCRATGMDGQLLTGFAIEVAASRTLPGTGIGRAERLGRQLHEGHHELVARMLVESARRIPRLQRLDLQIFDEDQARRWSLISAIRAMGGTIDPTPRHYTGTLSLDLSGTEANVLRKLPYPTRRKIQKITEDPTLRVAPVLDPCYALRLEQLHQRAFQRTGGVAPNYRFADVLNDARMGTESTVVGVFREGRDAPEDLIAFGWTRLNGDYATYEAGGSEHSEELRHLSAGVGVIWELIRWARTQSAVWFDLGGVIPESTPKTHPLYGVRQFKRGFSVVEISVAQELSLTQETRLARLTTFARCLINSWHTRASRP